MNMRNIRHNRKIKFWSYIIGGILLSVSIYFLGYPSNIKIKLSFLTMLLVIPVELWTFIFDPWLRNKVGEKFHCSVLEGFPWKVPDNNSKIKLLLISLIQFLLFNGSAILFGFLFWFILSMVF
jgi:hypothetical protein